MKCPHCERDLPEVDALEPCRVDVCVGLLQRASAWLEVAATSGIDARYADGEPTPNGEGCWQLRREIDELIGSVHPAECSPLVRCLPSPQRRKEPQE